MSYGVAQEAALDFAATRSCCVQGRCSWRVTGAKKCLRPRNQPGDDVDTAVLIQVQVVPRWCHPPAVFLLRPVAWRRRDRTPKQAREGCEPIRLPLLESQLRLRLKLLLGRPVVARLCRGVPFTGGATHVMDVVVSDYREHTCFRNLPHQVLLESVSRVVQHRSIPTTVCHVAHHENGLWRRALVLNVIPQAIVQAEGPLVSTLRHRPGRGQILLVPPRVPDVGHEQHVQTTPAAASATCTVTAGSPSRREVPLSPRRTTAAYVIAGRSRSARPAAGPNVAFVRVL
mmetsp:Transcript_26764/g.67318  ORF Transcript_26764/g.67318 Transcript_26764/m.67318 type:complete len:286 (-) Transcript_26764:657-1514(-)